MRDNFKEFKEKNDICKVIEATVRRTAVQEGNGTKRIKPCPFPGCKSQSCFTIYEETQSFYTFACNTAKGDVHNFLQAFYNLEPYEALVKGCELTGFQLTHSKQTTQAAKTNIYDDIVNYYHKKFLNNPQALKYQTQTRCHDIENLKRLMIGFSDGHLHQYLNTKGYSLNEQLKTGLIVKKDDNIKDFFVKGVYVYPHKTLFGDYGHFTMKDPNKAYLYQLPNEYKHDECLFYNMPVLKKSDEIFIVEGENDAISLIEAGQKNVIATNGQISRAQVDYLRKWVDKDNNPRTIYLVFDNNDAGQGYTQTLMTALEDRCYVDLLNYELRTVDLTLKIIQFDKAVDIDAYLVKHCGTDHEMKKEKLEALKKNAKQHMMLLRKQIRLYKDSIEDKNKDAEPGNKIKPNNIFIGKICAEYFKCTGAYFVESDHDYRCNIFYKDRIYAISDNPLFNALMNRLAGLNASQNGFKIIRQEILDAAINTGKLVEIPGWITAKISTDTIYFNLCNDRKELLKVSPEAIEVIKNGSNMDGIYLREAANMSGVNYDDDISIKETMKDLETLIFNNLACNQSYKYYLICFLINTFFVNFINAKGLLKLSGNAGSGKTTAARLITCLIFKKDMISTGTVASSYTEAAISPLLCMDNLERDGLNRAVLELLLFVATGVTRRKRDKNSQTGNVYEKVNTQVIWTAIEPPEKEELIQRTIDIYFGREYWKEDFSETETMELIKEKRDQLLSGIVKLIAYKILPDFKNKRKKALKWLKQKYKGHSKERLNELTATLFVILKEVCVFLPYTGNTEGVPGHMAIIDQWIDTQNKIAKNTSMNTNPIIRYLSYLLSSYVNFKDNFEKDFPKIKATDELTESCNIDPSIKEFKSISFDYVTNDLLSFIGAEAKRMGEKNPFSSAGQLSERIRNSKHILTEANWNYVGKVKKASSGDRVYRLTKTFEIEQEPF